jgi:hypothetical protein
MTVIVSSRRLFDLGLGLGLGRFWFQFENGAVLNFKLDTYSPRLCYAGGSAV